METILIIESDDEEDANMTREASVYYQALPESDKRIVDEFCRQMFVRRHGDRKIMTPATIIKISEHQRSKIVA